VFPDPDRPTSDLSSSSLAAGGGAAGGGAAGIVGYIINLCVINYTNYTSRNLRCNSSSLTFTKGRFRLYLVEVNFGLSLEVLLWCSWFSEKFLQIVGCIVRLRHCFQCFGQHHEREAQNVEQRKLRR